MKEMPSKIEEKPIGSQTDTEEDIKNLSTQELKKRISEMRTMLARLEDEFENRPYSEQIKEEPFTNY